MKLYADAPARRARQVLGDLALLGWVALWVCVGRYVHGMVTALAEPVVSIQGQATDLSSRLRETTESVGQVPMVGDRLRGPFERLTGTGDGIAASSAGLVDQIHQVATVLAWVVAATPVLVVALWWLSRRVAWVRRAAVAQRFVDADADLDLFALRAMASQPLPVLARVSDDPVGAWRRGDAEVVRRLAAIELEDDGLRPPGATRA